MALMILADQCTSCGTCEAVCPEEAISRGDEAFMISPHLCTECEECVTACPMDCIRQADA
jgi:ferredoxin